ncbi:MAG: cytochrome c3 family protein, partial [Ramlibacter sp.]
LACHASEGLDKKLANGETLSLRVNAGAFAKSAHSMIGCAVCHGGVTLENHPPSKTKIASAREYSLAMTKVCSSCHSDISKLYENSIHASLLREGSARAPICTDCHNAHTAVAKSAYDAATGAPCSKCHDPIYKVYAGSVHGQASLACSNCHRAHDVSAATTGDHLKSACLGCHQDALASHQAWLPNAAGHFDAVSCAACHSPGAKRKVDLRLFDNVAQQRVTETAGVPQFESRARLADTKGTGLDAMALRSLLQGFNREGTEDKISLRGRLEVSTGAESHHLARSTEAIRDCAKCHQQGADPFQSVTVSVVGPDGRRVRYGADPSVLNSVISVDSIGGFYAIGGTRIKLLDWLLVVALLGGIGGPMGHMTARWLFKKYAKRIGGDEDS